MRVFEFSRRKNNRKNIKICPSCKKPTLSQIWGGMIGGRHKCANCEYEGTFYLEVNPNEDGDNFVDMEKLKEIFQDDLDTDTEIDLKDLDNLKNPLEKKKKDS